MKTNNSSGSKAVKQVVVSAVSLPVGSGTPATEAASAELAGGALATAATGFRLQVQQMLAGVQVVIPDGVSLAVTGGTMAKSAVVAQLQAAMAEYTAVETQGVALKQARQQLQGDLPTLRSQYAALKDALVAQLGRGSPLLAQCGLKPKTARKPLTSQQRVVAAAKALQTRALRGTKGKKQKAALQFTGEVSVSTQVNAPAMSPGAAPAVATVRPPGSTTGGSSG